MFIQAELSGVMWGLGESLAPAAAPASPVLLSQLVCVKDCSSNSNRYVCPLAFIYTPAMDVGTPDFGVLIGQYSNSESS